jgi:hypothetical protein
MGVRIVVSIDSTDTGVENSIDLTREVELDDPPLEDLTGEVRRLGELAAHAFFGRTPAAPF